MIDLEHIAHYRENNRIEAKKALGPKKFGTHGTLYYLYGLKSGKSCLRT